MLSTKESLYSYWGSLKLHLPFMKYLAWANLSDVNFHVHTIMRPDILLA